MKKLKAHLLLSLILFGLAGKLAYATDPHMIRVNQIGYYPNAPKVAIIKTEGNQDRFFIISEGKNDTVYRGILEPAVTSNYSSGKTQKADFSSVRKEGKYYLFVPGIGNSYTFNIKKEVHKEVAAAAIKGFYYQRMSMELPVKFAGTWARVAGHPDNMVMVHPSAESDSRPAGTIISSSKGWYDAGDYNKYVVNSGITMGTLLSLYEDFPAYFNKVNLSINESGNKVPDILDEVIYNLRWLLTMQDPNDGGVYHKLTTAKFEGMTVKPFEAKNQRYVVQKSTAAALNFAAVTAQSARIFKKFNKELPGLADSCLVASRKAWEWALKNPDLLYRQEEMNKKYEPAVSTGAYGDSNVSDEFIWAACELYISSGERSYLNKINIFPDEDMPLPSWSQVRLLGYYSLLRHHKVFAKVSQAQLDNLKANLLKFAESYISKISSNPYHTVFGSDLKDFIWGSSAVAANQGIAMIQAYLVSGEKKYLDHAVHNLDYLLGRNATGYSFLTGFGHKRALFPHHRVSESLSKGNPVPGLLIGGPNVGRQDKCDYPFLLPGESYIDDTCSYASNEIAINWNAPMAYLSGAIEALQKKAGY
jgi:endoglucanase